MTDLLPVTSAASPLAVHARVTETTYCALPEDHDLYELYAVKVSWRGGEQYAVTRRKRCLDGDGEWDWELSPSNRDDDWITTHRFGYDEACRLAAEAARHVTANRLTVADIINEPAR